MTTLTQPADISVDRPVARCPHCGRTYDRPFDALIDWYITCERRVLNVAWHLRRLCRLA